MLVISMMLSSLVGSWDVMAAGEIPAPKINDVFYGATSISGKDLHRDKVNKKTVRATVHVTLKDKEGKVKATLEVTPTSGSTWTVGLPKGVEVAEGDKVTVYQELNGKTSPVVTVDAKPSMAYNHKKDLQMPSGDFYLEQYSSNIVSKDEKAEALEILKKANPSLVDKISSIEFSIKGIEENKKAYYIVTYTDNSKSEEVEAPNLKIKKVTEKSRGYTLNPYNVVSTKIVGKVDGEGPFNNISVRIVLNIDKDEKDILCKGGTCKVVKSTVSAYPKVDPTTGIFEYNVGDSDLVLGKKWAIVVKEPGKFANCDTSVPEIAPPEKIEVKDPKKITPAEKDKIAAAIRKANTTANRTSKLPDGTGDNTGIPAVIEIDDQGNVKIISGNDVEVNNWDDDGNAIPEKNSDGSPKLKEGRGSSVATSTTEEIVVNLAPDVPEVKVEGGNVIVTPNEADTDVKKVEVTYTGTDGTEKTVIAEKTNTGWTTNDPEVTVENNGVVKLPTSKVQGNTTVSAKVTDDGGISQTDTEKKSSEAGNVVIKASVQTPSVTVDKTTGDVTVTPKDNDQDAKRLFITYTPAGSDSETTVIANKGEDGKWSIEGKTDFTQSEDGKSFTIINAKAKENSKVKAITKGATDDLKSEVAENTVPDKTAPKAPGVKVNTNDGSAQITPPTDPDTKTVTVKYSDPSGTEKTATATKENNVWKITQGADDGVTFDSTSGFIKIPYDKMKKADTVSATAKDDSGNESQPNTDTTLPPVPTVKVTEKKDITVTPQADAPAVNGMEITYTPGGEDTEKTITVVKGNDNNWKITGNPVDGISVDGSTGQVTIAEGVAKETSEVKAKSKIDTDKRSLYEGKVQVPESKAPEAPTVKVQEDGSVKITPKNEGETTVTVTYNKEDGSSVTLESKKVGGKWTIENPTNGESVDPDSGVITIPTGKTNPGDKVKATATKGSKTSEEGKDLTKPAPPTVTPNQGSGDVTITPPSKGNVDGMIIKYKKPDNTDGTIKVKKGVDGTWKFEGDAPEGVKVASDTGVVTIKKGHAKEKTPVTADSTIETLQTPDKNQGEQPALVPDKTAPQPPKVALDETSGNITITPPNDEDTTKVTVTYKKADGSQVKVVAKKANNTWTLTGEDGSAVTTKKLSIKLPASLRF